MRAQPEPTAPVAAGAVVPLAPFTSVELRDGVKAVLQYGPVQRVTLLKGSPEVTQVAVAGGEWLVIEKCRDKCPRGYELEIEIVTPKIAGISVAHGGTIESRGSFPRQAEISLAVSNGGTIDTRSILADKITAAVAEGGRIFAKPGTIMLASVVNGGIITYWGDAQVTSSTQHGGQVTKGAAADADKPLSDFNLPLPSVPNVPHVHSIQPVRNQ